MVLKGTTDTNYRLGSELGKGGEGTVYLIESHPELVAKIYNEPLETTKLSKLRHMISIADKQLDNYAAWPKDTLKDAKGNVVGFVMRKLTGYMPLHVLFSPMDRKRAFSDKGYNFLIHAARNLAAAVNSLHQLKLVIGDINEGNILVNGNGMIAFIDCDSIQVNNGPDYFFCEVGVARYTSPELLKKGTFSNTIRTANNDNFSLAVLLFQLLFLGRHPFAGKNISNKDLDEEAAIRTFQFAYSTRNNIRSLLPPNDSFDINNLSPKLLDMFHNAFEQEDHRPSAIEWATELDAFLKDLVICSKAKIHFYPSKMTHCPWCAFQEKRGILFFLDSSVINDFNTAGNFINGIKIEKLQLPPLNLYPAHPSEANAIDEQFYNYRSWNKWFAVLVTMLMGSLAAFIGIWLVAFALPMVWTLMKFISPWTFKMNDHLEVLKANHATLKAKVAEFEKVYNGLDKGTDYLSSYHLLSKVTADYNNLAAEHLFRRKREEEKLYNADLQIYLTNFDIRNHKIDMFGPGKKLSLWNSGIHTAADVQKLSQIKIQGIGPKNIQSLFSWQRQVASNFVFIPDKVKVDIELAKLNQQLSVKKTHLETTIKAEFRKYEAVKYNLVIQRDGLLLQANGLIMKTRQAELDYEEFRKFTNKL